MLGWSSSLVLGVGVGAALIRGVSAAPTTSPAGDPPDLSSPDAVISTTAPQPTHSPMLVHAPQEAAPVTVTTTATVIPSAAIDHSTPPTSTPATPVKVAGINIPSIAVTSRDVISVGLNPDKTLQVPPLSKVGQLGWYNGSPVPGETGPAVVLAHVDQRGHHGLFWNLSKLQVGGVVQIYRNDGQTATFRVTQNMTFPKADWDQYKQVVYGNTSGPELRLITCSGTASQEVVFADLISLSPTIGS